MEQQTISMATWWWSGVNYCCDPGYLCTLPDVENPYSKADGKTMSEWWDIYESFYSKPWIC